MPQEPKKRHSRQRQGKRRASIRLALPHAAKCSNCGNTHMFHTVCPACGFYKGAQMMTVKTKTENRSKQASSA